MSGYLSNEDTNELVFDKRTTNNDFQQRLLKAQQEIEDELDDQLDVDELDGDKTQQDLQKEYQRLAAYVQRNEAKIANLEGKLKRRQIKRSIEQSLTNMSPAQRAQRVEMELQHLKDTGEEEEEPEMDTLFEYILFLSADSAAGDLSKADFIKEHSETRKKALNDPIIVNESKTMDIVFEEVSNISKHNPEDDTTTRECTLTGTSTGKPFSVSFNVTEPSKMISNLSFDVGIEMQLDIGTQLESIREECDLLVFFRTLVHYSRLENQRKNTFSMWRDKFRHGSIIVDILSDSKLKFQNEDNNNLYILLDWKIVEKEVIKNGLDADLIENIMPVFDLEVVTDLGSGNVETNNFAEHLKSMIMDSGVVAAVNHFITNILD